MSTAEIRSPRAMLAGLSHLGRLFDKLRLYCADRLPETYRPNLGHPRGLDGLLCGFLGINFADLREMVSAGATDEDLVEWCFAHGMRPNPVQAMVWNEFARKFGWNDPAASFLDQVRDELGVADRADLTTAFHLIDHEEGRDPHAEP